jgi:universal stress protein E
VALNPDRTFEKPVGLDAEILAVGSIIADAMRGSLDAVHACLPVRPIASGQDVHSSTAIAELQRNAVQVAGRRLSKAVRAANIAADRQHVVARHVPDAIEEIAGECGSAIVVMGAVSRSGLKRLLIGNTAERVLNHLACDILVVKMPNVAGQLRAETAAARGNLGPVV